VRREERKGRLCGARWWPEEGGPRRAAKEELRRAIASVWRQREGRKKVGLLSHHSAKLRWRSGDTEARWSGGSTAAVLRAVKLELERWC